MERIIEQLKQWKPVPQAAHPQLKGFYAFYIINDSCFDGTALYELKQYDVIYIGIAEDETLAKRVYRMHLRDSGKSTLRRSLGAVLKEKYELQPIMRGITPTDANIRNYTFSEESEEKITKFMYDNFGVAFCPCENHEVNFEDTEKELIRKFLFPAFNIEYSGIQNSYKQRIKSLRKTCCDIVRQKNTTIT